MDNAVDAHRHGGEEKNAYTRKGDDIRSTLCDVTTLAEWEEDRQANREKEMKIEIEVERETERETVRQTER
eukprot:764641-Hanusia_phi.AAC.5